MGAKKRARKLAKRRQELKDAMKLEQLTFPNDTYITVPVKVAEQDYLPPAQRDSETSRAAAESIKPHTRTLREEILLVLRAYDPDGLTDEQIAQFMDLSPNTARPRRVELVREGKVIAAGKRKTSSGRQATVWKAV